MRATAVRHSPAGFGLLVNEPLDPAQTLDWVTPCLTDPAIRGDVARFAQAVDPQDLNTASERLDRFAGPALLVWGTADRFSSSGSRAGSAMRSPMAASSRLTAAGRSSHSTSRPGSPVRLPPSDRPALDPPRRAIRGRSALEPRRVAAGRPLCDLAATSLGTRTLRATRRSTVAAQPDGTTDPLAVGGNRTTICAAGSSSTSAPRSRRHGRRGWRCPDGAQSIGQGHERRDQMIELPSFACRDGRFLDTDR